MNTTDRIENLLKSFFLREMARQFKEVSQQAINENWDYHKYLEVLLEQEWEKRQENKKIRLLKQSSLPEGKNLGSLERKQWSAKINKQLNALLEGHFVSDKENLLAFGLPGRGKTHLLCALGQEMIRRHGYSVRFIPVYRLVQELLEAKKELALAKYLKKQSRYDVIILDDIGYVKQSREEMEVFFTFLADSYEERSLWISSNHNFSQWGSIFQDEMMAMAAIDRLIHHCVIIEFDGKSQRLK